MKVQNMYPRRAICECGKRIIPVGLPGTCWIHEDTELSGCENGEWAKAKKVVERGTRRVRRLR